MCDFAEYAVLQDSYLGWAEIPVIIIFFVTCDCMEKPEKFSHEIVRLREHFQRRLKYETWLLEKLILK